MQRDYPAEPQYYDGRCQNWSFLQKRVPVFIPSERNGGLFLREFTRKRYLLTPLSLLNVLRAYFPGSFIHMGKFINLQQ